jgi:hypothetical protein
MIFVDGVTRVLRVWADLQIMTGYEDDLELVHLLADQADAVTTKRFKAFDLRIETKPGLTPVSGMAAEPEVSLWDMAAIAVIVCEADGVSSTVGGEPSLGAGCACTCDGLLHEVLLTHLGSRQSSAERPACGD